MIIAALLLCGAALTAKALYIPVKAELAQILLERAFDQSLARGRPIKPWSWADTAPAARLRVPRLGVSEIVLDAGSGEAMAFGPAQVRDDRANAVTILSAHRDTHFAFIRDLAVGDEIVFEPIGRAPMRLRVIGFETVRWDQFSYTAADPNRARIALATCWPFGTHRPGPLRRVAWAEAIP
ncbi:MAG: sortase [Erythrobacter sp.]|nr:sortase [Erythrobacter sp.]